jgi:GH24 family phage-related lysozyme (muramidase)
MTDIDKAVADTAGFEGYKAAPYKDTRGLWTVGEGTCLEANPISASDWKYLLDNNFITISLSGAGARWLLRAKLAADLRGLSVRFPNFASLPDLVQTLLLEMSYQLGGLQQFATFDTLVAQLRFKEAAADARTTKWYSQTPNRAETILKQLESVT